MKTNLNTLGNLNLRGDSNALHPLKSLRPSKTKVAGRVVVTSVAATLIGAMAMSSCSKVDFSATPIGSGIDTSSSTGTPPVVLAPDLSCLANKVDYQVDAQIISFELTGGVNGGAGFSAGGVIPIGVNATYSSGELDTEMNLSQPLYGTNTVHSSLGKGKTNNFSVNASVIAGLISGSLGAWQSTGLFQVTQSTLTNNIQTLISGYPLETGWFSVINQNLGNNQFSIPLGSTAGVQIGDTFNVYKANYVWKGDGTPCKNPLELVDAQSSTPYTTVTVVQVAPDAAIVQPPDVASGANILPYDEVQINALVPDLNGVARTLLKHSIRLHSVTQPMALTFSDGKNSQTVDMTSVATSQLQAMLNNANFYLVP